MKFSIQAVFPFVVIFYMKIGHFFSYFLINSLYELEYYQELGKNKIQYIDLRYLVASIH